MLFKECNGVIVGKDCITIATLKLQFPQKHIFYPKTGGSSRFRGGDFGGAEKGCVVRCIL